MISFVILTQKMIYFWNNWILLQFWSIFYVLPGSIPDPFHGFSARSNGEGDLYNGVTESSTIHVDHVMT